VELSTWPTSFFVTTGTSPTTYDPGSAVTRLQMAAFLSRTVDKALQRGSDRAALHSAASEC